MNRANFKIESDVKGEPLVIRDVGPWDKYMTITNAAESVIADLYQMDRGLDLGRRVFYIDSEGLKDELVHAGGHFIRFAPGPRA